ncbi:MAG: peptide ABC transporter substrate-binding protein [Patescibacteria group bacterium]|jgi:peptide/nickel transport system substrate-binding protein
MRASLQHLAGKFSKKEKATLASLLAVIVICSGGLAIWQNQTGTVQPLQGGVFVEGIVGQPQIINPLYARTNSTEGDIAKLIFAGLVKMSPGREFLPDLAESWEIQNKSKSYLFHLRDNLKWPDGEKLTADDIVFTIDVVKSDAYTGPYKSDWQGITATATDARTVQFDLPDPSTFFLARATLGILPKHMWAHLPVAEMGEARNNALPVGAGPYLASAPITGQTSFDLEPNPNYYAGRALIEKIVFSSFDSEQTMFNALVNGNVTAAAFSTSVAQEMEALPNMNKFVYHLPQYKAVFFNQMGSNKILADVVVRQALALATDKERIIKVAADGYAVRADSPILPGFWGYLPEMKKYDFDISAAASTLSKAGWKDSDNDKIVEKNKTKLSFTLSFKDDKNNTAIAEVLAENWQTIGAEVILNPLNSGDLINQIIRPRNYEALIFGQSMGADSDPYLYWHSSQMADPGLALSIMYDKDIDNSLEMIRLSSDLNRAITYCHNFQKAFANLVPAVLLYQPTYTYIVDNKVKGDSASINLGATSDRFIDINKWYVRARKTLN